MNSVPKAIKHARIALYLLNVAVLVVFVLRCWNTGFYNGYKMSLFFAIVIQVIIWLSLWLSYKRPFIGLSIPSLLFLLASVNVIKTIQWESTAQLLGQITGIILFNFFQVRGAIVALLRYRFCKI